MVGSAWIRDRQTQISESITVVLVLVGCQYSYWPGLDHVSTGGQVRSFSNFMKYIPNGKEVFCYKKGKRRYWEDISTDVHYIIYQSNLIFVRWISSLILQTRKQTHTSQLACWWSHGNKRNCQDLASGLSDGLDVGPSTFPISPFIFLMGSLSLDKF